MLSTSKKNLNNQYRLGNNKTSKIRDNLRSLRQRADENLSSAQKHANVVLKMVGRNSTTPRTLNRLYTCQQKLREIDDKLAVFTHYNNTNKTNANTINIFSRGIEDIRQELELLLKQINTCIQNGFIYTHILKIIIKFIYLLSDTDTDTDNKDYDSTKADAMLFNKWINTPFIFFPSYMSINFQTVVALVSAPIL